MKQEFTITCESGFTMSWWVDWMRLVKFPISLLNTVAAVAGYLVCRPVVEPALIFTALSVAVLAGGSAALNNYQDREPDGRFPRTRERPLPRQVISQHLALVVGGLLVLCGLMGLLLRNDSLFPAGLGVLTVILYNGIYTPLKRGTVLAIIPGALCGMLPPFIGWAAAGGNVHGAQIAALMLILGVWQLPHFWLVLLSDAAVYRSAETANMLHLFSVGQLRRLVFVWSLAFACMAMFLPVIRVVVNPWLAGLLLICMALVMWHAGDMVRSDGLRAPRPYSFYFKWLNGSMAVLLLTVIVDRLP